MSETRMRDKGRLQTLIENRAKIGIEAKNNVALLVMKVDAFEELENLDTAAIKAAATELHTHVVEMRKLSTDINHLQQALYG
jgi:hypothetical protein